VAGDGDPSTVSLVQPGNAIENGCLARARRSKDNRESGTRAEVNIQVETSAGIGKPLSNLDFKLLIVILKITVLNWKG
jgi:hypothetical protein